MFRYAITDRRSGKGELNQSPGSDPFAGLVDQAKRLAAGGVDFLQLREKDLEAKELIGVARRIITAARSCGQAGGPVLRVLVNGRVDVALASGADGVHLPSGLEQLAVGQVRRLFAGRTAVVSVACHTLAEVERASGDGADLVLFSPVFGKELGSGEELAGVGLERLAEACRVAGETPVLALGGVTMENAQACVEAGAKGVAGMRLFQ
jgi:thiamine-phosphate pyrophosphorylase